MSPQSRRRSSSGGAGRHERGTQSLSPPEALFQEMLRAARELLAVRSPLDAELMVSELLGTWWGQHLTDADVEEVFGEALVDQAARAGTPAALALLTGIAYLGTPRQSAKAERAALALIEKGVARPRWADQVGAVTPGECWTSKDVYGDQETAICTFSYRGEERHALIALVDYNLGGTMRDAWVSSEIDKLLEYCRREARDNPLVRLESLRPSRARAMLQAALRETDGAASPPVSESFGSYHAFVRARIPTLRPGRAGASRPTFSRDSRAALAVEFLASDEAEELSDPSAAGRCADTVIDYGCDRDFGRPLRVSPTKVEVFLLEWLPRKVLLTPEEQEAMPHVLAAWTRWAGRQTGLSEQCVAATLDAVWDSTAKFAETYAAAAFSLPPRMVERLLPDRDLEALPRRAFAFPLLEGTQGGVELDPLDPTDPEDRRKLLRLEHLGHSGHDRNHLDLHEIVASQLWSGEPAETWDTVQRLLDSGYERHDVLHMIMDAIERSGGCSWDLKRLRRALDELP